MSQHLARVSRVEYVITCDHKMIILIIEYSKVNNKPTCFTCVVGFKNRINFKEPLHKSESKKNNNSINV